MSANVGRGVVLLGVARGLATTGMERGTSATFRGISSRLERHRRQPVIRGRWRTRTHTYDGRSWPKRSMETTGKIDVAYLPSHSQLLLVVMDDFDHNDWTVAFEDHSLSIILLATDVATQSNGILQSYS